MQETNYSVDRLNVDQGELTHIRAAILRLKQEFAMRGIGITKLSSNMSLNLGMV